MSFRASHETRILLLTLAAAAPASVVALWLLWSGPYSLRLQWALTILIIGVCWRVAMTVRERVARPLRTLSSLLEAMRHGDYSIRGRSSRADVAASATQDALDDVMQQVNAMAATLREQRLGALEATTLLRKVMEEIDVAVFAFDGEHRLRLVNRAGERLLGQPSERIQGSGAAALGLEEFLTGEVARTVQKAFPSGAGPGAGPGAGRWSITRSGFRESGLPHQLLVVTDLTRALREEELQAWQRLVRVLGHELNNSLTPIKSIAGSLETLIVREPLPDDWREDARRGLSIIASRSDGLARFLGAYTRLAKLPPPQLAPIHVGEFLAQVARLEPRVAVQLIAGPELTTLGDRAQLEQLLINLLRNAAEASLEAEVSLIEAASVELVPGKPTTAEAAAAPSIRLRWARVASHVEIVVEDQGPGLSNTANLFVPFFTTKPGGFGIGLVLGRQIAEAHGGSLELSNREDRQGCAARLSLPLREPDQPHA